jgi:hypothetical protein
MQKIAASCKLQVAGSPKQFLNLQLETCNLQPLFQNSQAVFTIG